MTAIHTPGREPAEGFGAPHSDHLLNFVINGWMPGKTAEELIGLPYEERQTLSTQIIEVTDGGAGNGDILESQQKRASWAAGILGRETLSETAQTVFVETAAVRPVSGIKLGLGERFGTPGRHSSSDTTDWSGW